MSEELGYVGVTAAQNRKRLGSGRTAPVAFFRPELSCVLVVGSDGLFSYAPRERIVEATTMGTAAEQLERLRRLVQLPSGRYEDDLGVVVVRAR